MGWEQYVFPYFPPAFAIYLLWISDLGKAHLDNEVKLADKVIPKQPTRDFVRNLAAGWSSKVGFFNASFASLFSALSVFSSTQSYGWLGVTVAVLLVVMIPMHLKLWGIHLDQVEASKITYLRLDLSPGRWCKVVLTLLNVLLLVAVLVNQIIKASASAT